MAPSDRYWISLAVIDGLTVVTGHGNSAIAPARGIALFYATAEERAAAHPELDIVCKPFALARELSQIDRESEIDKANTRSAKAREADLVLHENITDPARLPYLSKDLDHRIGETLTTIATEVWDKHTAMAEPEAVRVDLKRQARNA